MTVSNVVAMRPPDNPPSGPEWKPIPGARDYEASHRGKVRSLNRVSADGRHLRGVVLKMRLGTRAREGDTVYRVTDVRRDDGSKWTANVGRFVLLAHDRAPEPGEECCHGAGGPQDNRWPENIRWGTKEENEADKPREAREPPPPRECVNWERCHGYAVAQGRRCQACRVRIGQRAAVMFKDGADPEQVAKALDYGSANGAYRLAVQFGGLRLYVEDVAAEAAERAAGYGAYREPWLRRVINRARAWLADSDAE